MNGRVINAAFWLWVGLSDFFNTVGGDLPSNQFWRAKLVQAVSPYAAFYHLDSNAGLGMLIGHMLIPVVLWVLIDRNMRRAAAQKSAWDKEREQMK